MTSHYQRSSKPPKPRSLQSAVALRGDAVAQLASDRTSWPLVAYEIGHRKALAIVERAYEAHQSWDAAVRAAVATLLEFLACEPACAVALRPFASLSVR